MRINEESRTQTRQPANSGRKKSNHRRSSLGLRGVLLLLLCLSMVIPLAATTTSGRLGLGTPKYAEKIPSTDGAWADHYQPTPSAIGMQEAVCFPLRAGVDLMDGDRFNATLTADSLDLSTAQLILLRESGGVYIAKDLNFTFSQNGGANGENLIRCEIIFDSSWLESDSVCLLLQAPRLSNGGTVALDLSNILLSDMNSGGGLHLGDYSISKQKGETLTMPVGMSGVANASAAYIIRKDGTEMLRVIMDDDFVLGLAVREGVLVVGLDFDVAGKVYISSLSQKVIYTRGEMQAIFNGLDFSFVRPPMEQNWINRQESYTYNRSMAF